MTLPRPGERRGDDAPGGEPFVVTVPGSSSWARAGQAAAVDVVGRAWGAGPTVYLVHGWAGHRRQFAEFVSPLVARGLRVVAFDMPSHGESGAGAFGPRSTTFLEFAATIEAVVARWGQPHAIVAHSAGAIATACALTDGMHADRLVLLAPMVGPVPHLRLFGRGLGFGERIFDRLVVRLEHRVGAPMRHFDVPELGRATAMPPTLIMHDRGDRSTPVSDSAAIAAAWPGARFHVTEGLGHNRLLRDPDVVTRAADLITA
jgi:pimeloyl-ACP methyl ester carboxylesterase